jgi:hypothetical protein
MWIEALASSTAPPKNFWRLRHDCLLAELYLA